MLHFKSRIVLMDKMDVISNITANKTELKLSDIYGESFTYKINNGSKTELCGSPYI